MDNTTTADPVAPTFGPQGQYTQPEAGLIISVVLSLASITIISSFLTHRWLAVKLWRMVPWVVWLVFAIFIDSWLFVFATAIIQFGIGVDTSFPSCEAAIILCLVCYLSSKILIYMFLVEKAYIIRGSKKARLRSKLYLFNSFGLIGGYCIVAATNFVFRITKMENGLCVIGMERMVIIPLVCYDVLVNIYLTISFLTPLAGLYTFKNVQRPPATLRLRTVALRTLVGALCTLSSSVVNLTVLLALNGEPGWVCLMCCNSDVLFSVIVIQWITSADNAATGGRHDSQTRSTRDLGAEESNIGMSRRSFSNVRHVNSIGELMLSEPVDAPSQSRRSVANSTVAVLDSAADIAVDRAESATSNSVLSADSTDKYAATATVKENDKQVRFSSDVDSVNRENISPHLSSEFYDPNLGAFASIIVSRNHNHTSDNGTDYNNTMTDK